MPKWLWFLPLGLIVLVGSLMAFRLGWIAANLDETQAIEAYAQRFVTREGKGLEPWNCFGEPGEAVWLLVRCTGEGRTWTYQVNRFGGLVGIIPPGGGASKGRVDA
ncbi:hypothetical protein [Pacificoceanicola onchidii]|uniref:hypothetical protein n=1 Tax=Pacificoceanicola onchidii TaxID=2562685 RepID=UPI0010A3A47E|nr:hypothetical protein [Pacificoceanicola onchidii]